MTGAMTAPLDGIRVLELNRVAPGSLLALTRMKPVCRAPSIHKPLRLIASAWAGSMRR